MVAITTHARARILLVFMLSPAGRQYYIRFPSIAGMVGANEKLRGAAVFCPVVLERLVGFLLQFVTLELSIKVVKLAELFENPIDLCHFQAFLCQPDPASSPSSS